VWRREDGVKVRTRQQSMLPTVQPTGTGQAIAHGAAAMATRVVGDLVKVPVGATVDVATHRGGAAVSHAHRCAHHVQREPIPLGKVIEVFLKQSLNRDGHPHSGTAPRGAVKHFAMPAKEVRDQSR
tara:strand:+ start:17387 stop:17764 length:378 start_codon:yes stop_codon:yes gene_type:complete